MSPPSLTNDLVEQILLRLPPDDPACLVRASLISKPVRRLLAGAAFRRRYREFHGRPHLLGFFEILNGDKPYYSRFVPTPVFRPAEPDRSDWLVVDCRHGRALFVTTNPKIEETIDLVARDPMTDGQRWVPQPSPSPEHYIDYSAAVLCAVEGCDHSGCQEGPFRVAFLSTDRMNGIMDARHYSSEIGAWSELTSVHHHRAYVTRSPSVLVGEGLYFYSITNHIIEYKLGMPRLSVIEPPTSCYGRLMTMEDGRLAFATVDDTILTLWSREARPKGADGWEKHRLIDLKTLLPDGVLSASQLGFKPRWYPTASVTGFAEGTDVIFVGTFISVYMVELKSGRVRKVLDDKARVFPYMSFHIPGVRAYNHVHSVAVICQFAVRNVRNIAVRSSQRNVEDSFFVLPFISW